MWLRINFKRNLSQNRFPRNAMLRQHLKYRNDGNPRSFLRNAVGYLVFLIGTSLFLTKLPKMTYDVKTTCKLSGVCKVHDCALRNFSLIIPGEYHHFLQYGHRLIRYMRYSVHPKPCEIIFVISNVPKGNISALHEYKQDCIALGCDILLFHNRQNQALNRNIGASLSSGDLISFFDVDDLPHPKRFQVIQEIFKKNPQINGLLTGYIPGDSKEWQKMEELFIDPNLDELNVVDSDFLSREYVKLVNGSKSVAELKQYWCCEKVTGVNVHNAWATYRKVVFDRYQYNSSDEWYRAEDTGLNIQFFTNFEKLTYIDFPLGLYLH